MTSSDSMKVEKIVGNNVVLAVDPLSSKEYVLFGKGLGFACKNEAVIRKDDTRIERRYKLDEGDSRERYESLVDDLDPDVIEVSERIIEMMKERLGTPVHPKVYFALPNHIQFAAYRLRNGMAINNPFLLETKLGFPMEFEIAGIAAEMIGRKLGIEVPEDETGFLALHVRSASVTMPVGRLALLAAAINDTVARIESGLRIDIPRDSRSYLRLVAHLREAFESLTEGRQAKNPLTAHIRESYPDEFGIASDAIRLAADALGFAGSIEDEAGYLALALNRFVQTFETKQQ
ncbi:transcription antiterminator BglG [Paenibacillus sp. CCS19]|uniref:PRD domain-containing protein n=1 Tax=Paenibacillus sp. CCS19 TaxID=3158387 RepID=UPI00256060DC|nr:PRD domain-containing protein [Paenibacillus cellulosilyticus]GMK37694.1 transcription antiterminator BglG [Paenibacillus cellulosilyticus]